jgi:hypothetical protein
LPRHNPILKSSRASVLALGLLGALVFGLACGGDSGSDSGAISEDEAKDFADKFFLTSIGLFTGQTDADAFVEMFDPECRDEVDTSGLAFVLLFIQGFAEDLQDVEIEEVDVGDITVEETADGATIAPANPESLRVKVEGEFVSADEFFAQYGFEESEDDLTDPEPVSVVKRGGELYIADCSELEGFAGE